MSHRGKSRAQRGASPDIFLSWSGPRSEAVASALRSWLPEVLEDRVRPWMSAQDIGPGVTWWEELVGVLRSRAMRSGIFVVTPENVHAPWMLFEAGAIAGKFQRSRAFVYLLGLGERSLLESTHPLQRYQSVRADRDGTLDLVRAISQQLATPVQPKTLEALFERHWPALEGVLREAGRPGDAARERAESEDASPRHPEGYHEVAWSCLVPRLPFPERIMDALTASLRQIREEAHALVVRDAGDGVPLRDVRACVFLPALNKLQRGICELHIPDGLADWDDPIDPSDVVEDERHRRELGIRFWLDQGLSGRVFVQRRPGIALSNPHDPGSTAMTDARWPSLYGLSDYQKRAIHPKMKWVVAFPLKRNSGEDGGARQQVMGVVAVDGLEHPLTHGQLGRLMTELIIPVNDLAGRLSVARMSRIVFRVEESVDDV